jgi:hypothetical protein
MPGVKPPWKNREFGTTGSTDMAIDPAAAVERLAELRERERLKKRRQREKRRMVNARIPGTAGAVPGMVGADLPVQASQPLTQQPPRQRVIVVKRPGVAAVGENELTWEQWQALGSETGTDCPRIREFLQRRSGNQQLGGQ